MLVTLSRSLGVGVLRDEDQVINMGASDEERMNSAMFMVVVVFLRCR